MSTANALNIRVHRFFTQPDIVKDINGKPTGDVIYRDYVEYGPPGMANTQTTVARIDRLSRVSEPHGSPNPAIGMAWNRWKYIEPSYLAWKKGEELPDEGTLLAACSFLRPEDISVLKFAGVKTVEDLATLLDSNMEKIKLPQMREKRAQAKAFLEATDINKTTAQLEQLARDNAELRAQMLEFKLQMEMKQEVKNIADEKAAALDEVDENGDRIPKKRKTLSVPQQAA